DPRLGDRDLLAEAAHRLREALALGSGRLELHARTPEGLRALGQARLELLERRRGLHEVDASQVELLALLGELMRQALDRGGDAHELLLRGIPLGEQLNTAASGAGSATQHVL